MSRFSNDLMMRLADSRNSVFRQPRAAIDCAAGGLRDCGYDQSVIETLMVALCVIVVHVFGDGTS